MKVWANKRLKCNDSPELRRQAFLNSNLATYSRNIIIAFVFCYTELTLVWRDKRFRRADGPPATQFNIHVQLSSTASFSWLQKLSRFFFLWVETYHGLASCFLLFTKTKNSLTRKLRVRIFIVLKINLERWKNLGADGTRTRDILRDRQAL